MYLSQGTSSLKSFSENGIVTTKENVQGKLKNCGIYCVLVGYSVYHANDVYEMLNFDSKLIVNLRDIKWLNLYHTDWIAKKIPVADHINNDYDDNDIIIQRETNDVLDSSINFSYQADKPSVDVKIYRQMKQIESSFNPKASKIVDEFEQGREVMQVLQCSFVERLKKLRPLKKLGIARIPQITRNGGMQSKRIK
jgi:hypothetical protein